MSDFFMNIGFNWTWSKALPYVLFLILGIAIFLKFKSKFKKRLVKIIFGLIIVIPVGVYFVFSPIYEGDFSNSFRELEINSSLNFHSKELTVLAISNCPYCAQSIERLNKIIERTEVERINFVVLTDNLEALDYYRSLASDKIEISNVADFETYEGITLGRYPTFVYSGSAKMQIWSNDGFGVRAIDWVENEISK